MPASASEQVGTSGELRHNYTVRSVSGLLYHSACMCSITMITMYITMCIIVIIQIYSFIQCFVDINFIRYAINDSY